MSSRMNLSLTSSSTQPGKQSPAPGRVEAQLPNGGDSYKYTALPAGDIRFLALKTGKPSHPINIRIYSIDLHDSKNYLEGITALSYTWGKPTPAQTVYCQGTNTGSLSVTPNLYDALVALRSEHDARFLWIDQICINQRDNEEKSVQVRLMGEIYSKSKDVWVWLSKEVFLCSELPVHLNTMLGLYDKLVVGVKQSASEAERTSETTVGSLSDVSEECWAAVKLIFHHPYFTRIWMIQEVVMAKEAFV